MKTRSDNKRKQTDSKTKNVKPLRHSQRNVTKLARRLRVEKPTSENYKHYMNELHSQPLVFEEWNDRIKLLRTHEEFMEFLKAVWTWLFDFRIGLGQLVNWEIVSEILYNSVEVRLNTAEVVNALSHEEMAKCRNLFNKCVANLKKLRRTTK